MRGALKRASSSANSWLSVPLLLTEVIASDDALQIFYRRAFCPNCEGRGISVFGFKGFGSPDPERERRKAEAAAEKAEAFEAAKEKERAAYAAKMARIKSDEAAEEIRLSEIRARSKWIYEEHADEMRQTRLILAQLGSDDPIDLPFPYSGGSTGFLTIRKGGPRADLIFSVSQGQFQFGRMIYVISTKADDGKVLEWSGSKPSSGDSSTMFLTQADALIRDIAGSKRFMIEAQFYNAGPKQFVFSPEGLDPRFRS